VDEGVWFESLRVTSLLFADDESECKAARMKISSSKSEAMVLNNKSKNAALIQFMDDSAPPYTD